MRAAFSAPTVVALRSMVVAINLSCYYFIQILFNCVLFTIKLFQIKLAYNTVLNHISFTEENISIEQFQFRLTVHYPMMRLKQFQDDLMLHYKIKALQISYSTSSVCDFGWLSKGNSLFPQNNFYSD